MKRKLMFILVLVLGLSITACTNNNDIDGDKTPTTENNEKSDEGVKTDDTPEVLDDEGELDDTSEELGEVSDKWPEDFMPEAPKLSGDVVKLKEEGPNKYFIELKNIKYEDAVSYVDSIKKAGFTDIKNEHMGNNSINYKVMDKNNNLLIFHWDKSEFVKLELIKN